MKTDNLRADALRYHSEGRPGKIEVIPTKPYDTQRELSLAYSPGVAAPCLEIEKNPLDAYRYTAKGNLVAVISNGTAVLGLGNIGALASKPVMEGKSMLFKTFADVDAFDIEVDAANPDQFVETVRRIAPTFGGINLEDIKAPECFEIEERLRNELDIPVMHDDQHGTAIITSAAHAIAALAKEPVPHEVLEAYGVRELHFGKDYLIPKPLDRRLIVSVAPAVARAAMESGAARLAIADWDAYRLRLKERVERSNKFVHCRHEAEGVR